MTVSMAVSVTGVLPVLIDDIRISDAASMLPISYQSVYM